MAGGDPKFRNSTSFSKTNQPATRGRGKAKATQARQAFHSLGYSPVKTMVAMTQLYMDMIEKNEDWDGKTIKWEQKEKWIDKVMTAAEKLLPYEFAKATPEQAFDELPSGNETPTIESPPTKTIEQPEDPAAPLDVGQLAAAQQKMATNSAAVKEGLMGKL